VAFSVDEVYASAWAVIMGRFEGGKFDETTMSWVDPKG
jgi:hypothetical protein